MGLLFHCEEIVGGFCIGPLKSEFVVFCVCYLTASMRITLFLTRRTSVVIVGFALS